MSKGYLESLPNGWLQYCTCGEYMRQSDPQNNSLGKTVVVFEDEVCELCEKGAIQCQKESIKENPE